MSEYERVSKLVEDVTGDASGFQDSYRDRLTSKRAFVMFFPFQRRQSIAERFGAAEPRETNGATLRDVQGGVEYDVVLDERGRPTYYAVRAIDGALSGVEEWPRDHVALLVRQFLNDGEDQLSRDDATKADALEGRPRHEYIAHLIREAHAAGVSPRVAVKAQTGKPWPTVDRWLRDARKHDSTLPQATRHPGKRSTTQRTEGQ